MRKDRLGRQYRVRPGAGDNGLHPPIHGLGEKHWAVLMLLAEHGALHTGQITTLRFGSRPATARHLAVLTRAGLVLRFVHANDPSHLAFYELSADGAYALVQRLRDSGQTVPAALGRPVPDERLVNDFFVGLADEARRDGQAGLYEWQRALDAAAWLRRRGVRYANPTAYGVWIEGGTAVRFLLHVDHGEPAPLSGTPAPPPSHALAGYWAAAGVPVTSILVVFRRVAREQRLHRELSEAPLPVTVATTTLKRLSAASSAADAIWTVAGPGRTDPVRLVDVAAPVTTDRGSDLP